VAARPPEDQGLLLGGGRHGLRGRRQGVDSGVGRWKNAAQHPAHGLQVRLEEQQLGKPQTIFLNPLVRKQFFYLQKLTFSLLNFFFLILCGSSCHYVRII